MTRPADWLAGKDGRGREVRFAWSTGRNAAGYFLSWREVAGKSGGKRDKYAARKKRNDAKALADRRMRAWQARQKAA